MACNSIGFIDDIVILLTETAQCFDKWIKAAQALNLLLLAISSLCSIFFCLIESTCGMSSKECERVEDADDMESDDDSDEHDFPNSW